MKGAPWFWIFSIQTYSNRKGCLWRKKLAHKKTDLPSREGFVTETCSWYGEAAVNFSQGSFSSVAFLFSFFIIWDGIPLYGLGWLWIYNPPALVSWVVGMRSRRHHTWVYFHVKKRRGPYSINISAACLRGANSRGQTGSIMLPKIIKFRNIKKIFFELQNSIKQTLGLNLRYCGLAST